MSQTKQAISFVMAIMKAFETIHGREATDEEIRQEIEYANEKARWN